MPAKLSIQLTSEVILGVGLDAYQAALPASENGPEDPTAGTLIEQDDIGWITYSKAKYDAEMPTPTGLL